MPVVAGVATLRPSHGIVALLSEARIVSSVPFSRTLRGVDGGRTAGELDKPRPDTTGGLLSGLLAITRRTGQMHRCLLRYSESERRLRVDGGDGRRSRKPDEGGTDRRGDPVARGHSRPPR